MASSGVNFDAVLPMLAMKDGADIKGILKNVLIMDLGRKALPIVVKAIGDMWNAWRRRDVVVEPETPRKEKEASIYLHRLFDKDHVNDAFDALTWRLGQLEQTKFMKVSASGVYVIANIGAIHIEDGIYAKQHSVTYDDKHDVTDASIELFSRSVGLLELKRYLAQLERAYRLHRDNELGTQLMYFDQLPGQVPISHEGDIQYDRIPKHMTFAMAPMNTNKSMANMYGDAVRVLKQRVHFFVNNRRWYAEKGIPYTLGILMHGLPGCGKTSTCKALSSDCNRHVVNLKLSAATTVSQLNALFFTERLSVLSDGASQTFNIPMDRRIIVMEDVDCLSDVVLDRNLNARPDRNLNARPDRKQSARPESAAMDWQLDGAPAGAGDDAFSAFEPVPQKAPGDAAPKAGMSAPDHSEKLTLGYLLNVLDGVLETPGRIIVMTSNFPERLDRALVRPGRIDVNVRFDNCSIADIHEMIQGITDRECDLALLDHVPERHWTPAEVTAKIFENIEDTGAIIASLAA